MSILKTFGFFLLGRMDKVYVEKSLVLIVNLHIDSVVFTSDFI